MRVLLVYPKPTMESPQKTPPLSILYIGAYAERRGYIVEYFDERWDNDFDDKLQRADVVGVSAMSGFQLKRALIFLNKAHEAGKVTIMGGVHATISPATCIAEPYIDYVVVGEGEVTLLDLLDNLNTPDQILGIWFKTQDNPNGIYTGNRQSLPGNMIESPITDNTLPYFKLAARSNDVMLPASRGCVNNCGFCYNSAKPDGGKWRSIPIDTWVKDLDYLLSNGVKIPFLQVGDDWLGSKKRVFAVGRELGARGIEWYASLCSNQIDEDLVSQLKSLRCTGLFIGAESGSDEILKVMNKRIKVSDTLNAATILAKYDIKTFYYFVLGIPTETSSQMMMTMDLADKLYKIHRGNCSMAFFGFDPLIGTALYKLAESVGYSVPKTLIECCERERCHTNNKILDAIYYIAGLTFHRTKGDKTDKNFPGIRRLLIYPFELLCIIRWRYRLFKFFKLEQYIIKWLLTNATKKVG